MAEKVIYFKMEVDGIETTFRSAGELKKELKAVKDAMKDANGDEFLELEKKSLKLRASLKDVEAEQRSIIKALQASETGMESYDRLSYSLGELRNAYRQLSKEERQNADVGGELLKSINRLDTELKEIDATMGNFQRNVGNYKSAFDGFTSGIPIIQDVQGVMGDLSMATGGVGKAVVVAVALFKGFQEAAKYISETVEKVEKLRSEVSIVSSEIGGDLDSITAKTQALADTYGEDTERIIRGTNAVSKAFGIEYAEALRLVEDGYKSGAGASDEYLDILAEYPVQFKASGSSAEEFFAVISEGGKAGIYDDKMVDSVKEFGLRIREQTDPVRDALIGAFGNKFTEELLSNVNSGKVSSIEAMREVSRELGETELTAAQTQTVIADVFGAAGEDAGLDFILSLKDVKGSMSELIDVNDEYVKKNEERMRINEEIAMAEVELSNAYKGSTADIGIMSSELKKVGIEILTGLSPALDFLAGGLKIVWELVKIGISIVSVPFKLIRDGAAYAGEAIGVLDKDIRLMNEGFRKGSEEVENQETKLRSLLSELKKTNVGTEERRAILAKITELQPDLLNGYNLEFASINQINKAEGGLIETLRTKISVRLKEKELEELMDKRNDVQSKIKERQDRGEKESVKVVNVPLLGSFVRASALSELKGQEKALNENINKVERYYEDLATVKEKGVQKVEKKAGLGFDVKKSGENDKKADDAKKAELALTKSSESALFQARAMAREQMAEMMSKYQGIERDIVKLGIEESLELMKDGLAKQLAIEEKRYNESVELLMSKSVSFEEMAKSQADKIALAIGNSNREVIKLREKGDLEGAEKRAIIAGRSSDEYIAFVKKAKEQTLDLEKNANFLLENESKIHVQNISEIDKNWNVERLKKLKESIEKRFELFESGLKREDVEERKRVAQSVLNQIKALSGLDEETKAYRAFEFEVKLDTEKFEYDKNRLEKELQELNTEFGQLLIGGADDGDLKNQLDKINELKAALIELEVDRTAAKAQESEKRREIEQQEAEKTLGYVNDVLSMISDISEVTKERELENVDKRKEAEVERLDELEEKLKTANKTEKVEIEKQIKFQKQKIQEVDDERAQIEESAAQRARFIRISQLISSTALAVMQEFARTGLGGAILAGATGAVQLGIMLAEPFADGGRVTDMESISGESVGFSRGKYIDIAEMANGDNVLATLRKGEVVLNIGQQMMLGGDETFRKIGVRGFAGGGLVEGGVPGLYMMEKNLSPKTDESMKELMMMVKNDVLGLVKDVNARIDRLEVVLVTDDLIEELRDREDSVKESTFG